MFWPLKDFVEGSSLKVLESLISFQPSDLSMLIENISIVKTPNQPKLTLPRFGFYVKMTVDRPPPTHPPQTPISQLLLAPF